MPLVGRRPTRTLAEAPTPGFLFGVGWTRRLGPTARAILMLSPSATGRVGARAAAVGLGSTAGLGRLGRTLEVLRRNGRRLQIGGGALLVLVGLALRPLIEGVELPL